MVNLENLDVYFSLNSFNETELKDKTSEIIDVLNAGSVIVTALMNGADAIIPVADMGEASKIAMNVDSKKYLLCGEKDGIKIDGYDLYNSPFEYCNEIVACKKLIFNTSNGTKAIKKAFGSSNVCVASFLNVSAVVDFLRCQKGDVVLVCAGWRGHLAIEDMLLAGLIVYKLSDGILPENTRDGVRVAFTLYDTYKDDINSIVREGNQAKRISKSRGIDDIEYCCQFDMTDVLPVLDKKMIIKKRDEEAELADFESRP